MKYNFINIAVDIVKGILWFIALILLGTIISFLFFIYFKTAIAILFAVILLLIYKANKFRFKQLKRVKELKQKYPFIATLRDFNIDVFKFRDKNKFRDKKSTEFFVTFVDKALFEASIIIPTPPDADLDLDWGEKQFDRYFIVNKNAQMVEIKEKGEHKITFQEANYLIRFTDYKIPEDISNGHGFLYSEPITYKQMIEIIELKQKH